MPRDEYNIYSIRSIVAGLSIVTLDYWYTVSPPLGTSWVVAVGFYPGFPVSHWWWNAAAILWGGDFAFLGLVIGLGYGTVRKRQRQTTGATWHPKYLCW